MVMAPVAMVPRPRISGWHVPNSADEKSYDISLLIRPCEYTEYSRRPGLADANIRKNAHRNGQGG